MSYWIRSQIIKHACIAMNDIVGNTEVLKKLQPEDFVTDLFGLPTVTDIIRELDKPGRDPRPEFKTANFKDDVQSLKDLKVGMKLSFHYQVLLMKFLNWLDALLNLQKIV